MRVLIADDDPVSRCVLEDALSEWGYEVVTVTDGCQARDELLSEGGPQLAVLDWIMPGMSGPEVCQDVRGGPSAHYVYIILLTVKKDKEDLVAALEAGADDFVSKPFDAQELRVRVRGGQRVVELQAELLEAIELLGKMNEQLTREIIDKKNAEGQKEQLIGELTEALAQVKKLSGLLPICTSCKKIRDDQGKWQQMEVYIHERSEAQFSHSICPDCAKRLYPEYYE